MVQAAVQYSSPNTLILEIQTYCTTDFTCILYFYTLYQMLYIMYCTYNIFTCVLYFYIFV